MHFFNLIFENIPQAIFVADPDTGKILFANQSAEILLGLPKEKIIGLHQSELHPNQEDIDYKKIFQEDIKKKVNYPKIRNAYKNQTFFVKHSSGRWIPVEIFSSIFFFDNKKYIIGLFIDVTKKNKLKKRNKILDTILLKTEEVFQQGSFLCKIRSNQKRYFFSKGAKLILGLKSNIIKESDLFKLVIEEQKEELKDFLSDVSMINKTITKNFIFFTDNKFKIIEIQKFIMSQTEYFGILKDITLEYKNLERLKTKEIHLRILSECHKALFYSQEEYVLLNQICKIIVETGGYLIAWIGYKKYDAERNIEIVAYYTKYKELENYIKELKLNWRDDNPYGKGPAGTACREGKIDIEKDLYFSDRFKPIQNLIVKYGLQSVIAIPIFLIDRIFAVLLVYSEYPDAFKEEEIKILNELSISLGLGINLLRERKSKLKLLEQNILLTKVLDNTNIAILVVGKNGNILYLNKKFEELSGYLMDEIIGKNINILKSGLHDQKFYQEMWLTLLEKKDWKGEIINKRKDGSLFLSKVFISPVLNNHGEISHFIQILEDITLEKYYEEQLEKTKFYDPLTKLPNRNFFVEKLNQSIRHGENFYLFLIDIDHFSQIVHDIGYDESDRLLSEFAQSIKNFVDSEIPEKVLIQEIFLARVGSDEFGLIITSSNTDFIIEFAKKIIENVKKSYSLANREYILTFSIGISIFPNDAKNSDNLLRFAEMALKRSKKEKGPGSFAFLTKEAEKEILERSKIENQLQTSVFHLTTKEKSKIFESGFYLEYQPIYNLLTNQIVSLEALIRWNNPKLGIIPPSKFIPLAEDSKLVIPLGKFVIEEACRQIIDWQEKDIPVVPIAINISYTQLRQKDFLFFLKNVLNEHNLDPFFLEFEITESTILNEDQNTKEILEELKKLHIKLLIDDFGSGYSSLSYLLRYEFDMIKIDQLFIKMLSKNSIKENNALKIIRSIIQIAKSLELTTIAEGIEMQEQKYILINEGCEFGQGYFLSMPKKAEEIQKLLLMSKKT